VGAPWASAVWEAYWADPSNHEWWKTPAPEVLDLIRSLSPRERPRVLDLGCGLGRHAIAFALAGFEVTAVDSSETAIEHLVSWARGLGLTVQAGVCDVLDEAFPAASFDVVLSYNVIYHGSRERFAAAIRRARDLLVPGGIFFFTCPTRRDGKYGFGPLVAPHTYACEKSVTPGDVHYFADEADLDELLKGFPTVSRRLDEGYWDHDGTEQFFSNWAIRAEKEPATDDRPEKPPASHTREVSPPPRAGVI
jgi:SAM-dependent methyltransferase